MDRQGFRTASGVLLHRRIAGEGDLFLTLFLREMGMVRAFAKGAASGRVRFGGGTEPLAWGVFTLYKGKGDHWYLKGTDVVDDMLKLRGRSKALLAAVRWAKLLIRHLMPGHPADELLANLYWNMTLLDKNTLPAEVLEWRFLWRWLKNWGLAPDLTCCAQCGSASDSFLWAEDGLYCKNCGHGDLERDNRIFSDDDLSFLRIIAEKRFSEFEEFRDAQNPFPESRLFVRAALCAERLLTEI